MADSPLENAFDIGFEKYLDSYYSLFRVPDYPFSKKNKQPPDRILMSKKKNVAIEMKYTSTERMLCQRIKEHQIDDLQNFKSRSGDAYLLFSLNGLDLVFLTDIDDFLSFKEQIGQESFTQTHLNKLKYKKIKIIVPRSRKHLDLRFLIPDQTDLTKFFGNSDNKDR